MRRWTRTMIQPAVATVTALSQCAGPAPQHGGFLVSRRWRTQHRAGAWWPGLEEDSLLQNEAPLDSSLGIILKPETTLVDLFEQCVRAYGPRRFIGTKMMVRGSLSYMWSTYETLDKEIEVMRTLLHAMGVTKGSRVMVISENRYEFFVVHMATLQLGAQHVVLPTSITPEEARLIAHATRSRVVFVESPASYAAIKSWVGTVGDVQQVFCFDDDGSEGSYAVAVTMASTASSTEPVCQEIECNDTALIQFTPATTGPPKGVMLSHKALIANVASISAKLGEALTSEDLCLSLAPWCLSGSLTADLYQIMIKGASLCVPPEIMEGFSDIATVNPSVLFAVNLPFLRAYNNIIDEIMNANAVQRDATRYALGQLLETRTHNNAPSFVTQSLSSVLLRKYRAAFGNDLRMAVIVGNPVPREQMELFADLNIFLVNTYTCAETGGVIATDIDVPGRLKVLPGIEARVVNEQGEVVSPGDLGEILVEAPNAMQGYFNINISDEEAANALVLYGSRSFVRTGDYGTLTHDWITVKGNRDVLIVLDDGKLVEPLEAEAKYQTSPFIKQVYLYGNKRSHVVALVVPHTRAISNHLKKVERRDGIPVVTDREKADTIRQEIRRLSEGLPPRSHIRRFAFVDEFTLANGFMTSKWGLARDRIERHYTHYLTALYDDDPKFHGYAVDDYDDLTSLF
eukprot:PhM_4_TR10991/c0_g1_i1/m.105565/K01897/ACSL, fadD; long-chain acyl-CoA synthetase